MGLWMLTGRIVLVFVSGVVCVFSAVGVIIIVGLIGVGIIRFCSFNCN